MRLLGFSVKLGTRRLLLLLSYVLFLLFLNFFYLDRIHWLKVSGYSEFLPDSQNFGIVGFLFFAFFSYEYFGNERHVSLSELMDVYPLGRAKTYCCQFAVMAFLIAVATGMAVGYQCWCYDFAGIIDENVLRHAIANVFLNFALVMVIGCLLGVVAANIAKRTTAYALLLISTFLISPFMDTVANVLSGFVDCYRVLDYIAILAPNLDWRPDDLYGVSVEPARWNVAFLWVSLLLAVIVYLVCGRRQKRAFIATIVLAAFSAAQFFMAAQMHHDSIIRKDDRRDGALSGDFYYWKEHESRAVDADFEVLSYEMQLDIGRRLSAQVAVSVTPEKTGRYLFTLYHGYEISEITDADGNALEYQRDGDYLEIKYDCPGEGGEIRFSYAGSGNKYYSNEQGIALPGYFPYYPMAGYVDTWDEKGNDIIVNTAFEEMQFQVTVHSDLPLMTNLEQTGSNTYAGTSTALTIYGGMLEVREENGVQYMYLPISDTTLDIAAIEAGTGMDLSGMAVMLQPATIVSAAGSNQENTVIFDDHIIVSSYFTQYLIDMLTEHCQAANSDMG